MGSDIVAPDFRYLFRPLASLKPTDIKVVITAPEPYPYSRLPHDGLAYSVPLPPLVRSDGTLGWHSVQQARMMKELMRDAKIPFPKHGALDKWIDQGVFLWNFCLTTSKVHGTHHMWGWDRLSREVLEYIALANPRTVFVPWGLPKDGINSIHKLVTTDTTVLDIPGPDTPVASGWAGSSPFTKINATLKERDYKPIDWRIT